MRFDRLRISLRDLQRRRRQCAVARPAWSWCYRKYGASSSYENKMGLKIYRNDDFYIVPKVKKQVVPNINYRKSTGSEYVLRKLMQNRNEKCDEKTAEEFLTYGFQRLCDVESRFNDYQESDIRKFWSKCEKSFLRRGDVYRCKSFERARKANVRIFQQWKIQKSWSVRHKICQKSHRKILVLLTLLISHCFAIFGHSVNPSTWTNTHSLSANRVRKWVIGKCKDWNKWWRSYFF